MNLLELAKELDADPAKLLVICIERDLLDVGMHWQLQFHDVNVPDRNVAALRGFWYETSAAETLKMMNAGTRTEETEDEEV